MTSNGWSRPSYYRSNCLNERGFTLIEFLIAALLSAIVLAGAVLGLQQAQTTLSQSNSTGEIEGETLAALQHIRRVGRVAQSCEKKGTAPDFYLECIVDSVTPSNGVTTSARFLRVGDALEYQVMTPPTGGAWETKATYRGIAAFILCDDAAMALPTGGCPLLPTTISEANTDNYSAGRTNRYFRYGLVGVAAGAVRAATIPYQGAFFVRNPSPLGPNIFYQYGG